MGKVIAKARNIIPVIGMAFTIGNPAVSKCIKVFLVAQKKLFLKYKQNYYTLIELRTFEHLNNELRSRFVALTGFQYFPFLGESRVEKQKARLQRH